MESKIDLNDLNSSILEFREHFDATINEMRNENKKVSEILENLKCDFATASNVIKSLTEKVCKIERNLSKINKEELESVVKEVFKVNKTDVGLELNICDLQTEKESTEEIKLNGEILEKLFNDLKNQNQKIIIVTIIESKENQIKSFLDFIFKHLNGKFSINSIYDTNTTEKVCLKKETADNKSFDLTIVNQLIEDETKDQYTLLFVRADLNLNDSSQLNNELIFLEFLTTISSLQILCFDQEIELERIKQIYKFTKAENHENFILSLIIFVSNWPNSNEGKNKENIRKCFEFIDPESNIRINCILQVEDIECNNVNELKEMKQTIENLLIKEFTKTIANGCKKINMEKCFYDFFSDFPANHENLLSMEITNDHESSKKFDKSIKDCNSSANNKEKFKRLFSVTAENKLVIDDEAIKEIFNDPELKDRKIITVTVVGSTRKGKSFLLNYCLRYLYAHYPSINCPNNPTTTTTENWMGKENEPLTGFSWRSGSTRDTSGIVVWNDAFLFEDSNTGDKFAIKLIDTQGIFDNTDYNDESITVLTTALSISSIIIFNIFDEVQENQLKYLERALDIKKSTNLKNIKNLYFLLRDWSNEEEFSIDQDGGQKYLEYFLRSETNKSENYKKACRTIQDSFDNIECYLLPYPGNIVNVGRHLNKEYNGCCGEMDEEFRHELKNFIEILLKRENFITNTNEENSEFLENLSANSQLMKQNLSSKRIFVTEQIVQETSHETQDRNIQTDFFKEVNNFIGECIKKYKTAMTEYSNNLKNNDLNICHEMSKSFAILHFERNKFQENINREELRKELINRLENEFLKRKEKPNDEINLLENEESEQSENHDVENNTEGNAQAKFSISKISALIFVVFGLSGVCTKLFKT